jgi:hypothetical protein
MVIGDVGQGAREEVDYAPSPAARVVGGGGANYGWNCREGFIAYPEPAAACASASGFVEPVFDYPHQDPGGGVAHGCSIIGGYVVRDPSLGALEGRYVYIDYCTGEIRSLLLPSIAGGRATDDRSEGLAVSEPTSFGEDSCGRLYIASAEGSVYRLAGSSPASCPGAGSPPSAPATAGDQAGGGAKKQQTGDGAKKQDKGAKKPLEEHLRLRLSEAPLGIADGAGFEITARLSPCAGNAGRVVHLRRGGRPMATKRLDRRCAARFHSRVIHRATFRAVLPGGETSAARSPRLSIDP